MFWLYLLVKCHLTSLNLSRQAACSSLYFTFVSCLFKLVCLLVSEYAVKVIFLRENSFCDSKNYQTIHA